MDIKDRLRAQHYLEGDRPVGARGVKDTHTEVKDRTITMIATTDDIDNDGEVVVPSGADLTYFKANRSVFADHDYNVRNFVGKVRDIRPVFDKGGEHRAWRVSVAVKSGEFGDDILTVAREMGIGCSIGFVPTDFGPPAKGDPDRYKAARSVVRAWEWLELSVTQLPCNVACQSDAMGGGDTAKASRLGELVTKGAIRERSARALGWRVPEPPRVAVRLVTLPDDLK